MSLFRKDKWAFKRIKWEIRKFVIVCLCRCKYSVSSFCPGRTVLIILLCFLPGSAAAPKRGFMAASFPEVSAFSQKMEAPERLLSGSGDSQMLLVPNNLHINSEGPSRSPHHLAPSTISYT